MPAFTRRYPALALLAAAWGMVVPTSTPAADLAVASTSLSKVPADAEAYGANFRMKEAFDAVAGSRVWAKLRNAPAVKDLWAKALAGYVSGEGEWAPVRQFLADPENQELPALLADAVSNEIFTYAGNGWGDTTALLMELMGAARYGPAIQQLTNPGQDAEKAERDRIRTLVVTLSEKPERIRLPDFVLGFKVSDPAKVTAQLKRLDPILTDTLKAVPVKNLSRRVKVGGDDFLVLEAAGSLVPWDDLLEKYENEDGEFLPLTKRLKAMKVSVAVGVRQGYLLVAIGESVDHLKKFGGGGPVLADRPEMKPLAKHAGKKLTAVTYVAAALRQATATTADDILGTGEMVKLGLKQAKLSDDLEEAVAADVDALAKLLAKQVVPPGAESSFSFRTGRGWETFSYDFTRPDRTEPKPLTLLNHVGGDPLLAFVGRSATTVEDYREAVKWLGKFAGHAEKAVLEKVPAAEGAVGVYRNDVLPLLREFNDVTEKLWLPALADGQQALVLDAKWTSKRWHAAAPPSEPALPAPELAIVLGVSDADKLAGALEGYRVAVNKALAKVRELVPQAGAMPALEIPKPQTERDAGRTFAFYPIPNELGIDPQFRPTGGLSDRVAVLALSRSHADRLLAETPLKADFAPLAKTDRPLSSAFYFNWAGWVDAVEPWIGHAAEQGVYGKEGPQVVGIARDVAGVLRVFRGYASATYREGDTTVTHTEAVFRDIEP